MEPLCFSVASLTHMAVPAERFDVAHHRIPVKLPSYFPECSFVPMMPSVFTVVKGFHDVLLKVLSLRGYLQLQVS